MTTPFGAPTQVQPRSIVSTLIVEPTTGFDVSHSALNIAAGATPNSDNFIMRDGRLKPRSGLSMLRLGNDQTGGTPPFRFYDVCGGTDAVAVGGTRYLLVGTRSDSSLGTELQPRMYFRGPGDASWNTASYTTAAGIFDRPVANATNYWDFTQIYLDRTEENIVVGALTSRNSGLYCWQPGQTVFSTLTGSPGAKCVAAFDNYLLAGNVYEGGDTFIQRVRWCDRGSASSWTGGLSGFEDLLSAKGGINRILPLENRIAVFFDDEIWTGTPIDFPGTFRFTPLDTSLGCPYPWTVAVTPRGIVFMARNFQMHLLPKEGGTAVAIGTPIQRSIRDSIEQASRAFGAYDGVNNFYQFYYNSAGSGNLPHRAVFLNLDTGAWMPQSFSSDQGLLRAFTANIALSNATSWDEIIVAWDGTTTPWDDMLGLGNERQVVVAVGTGSGVYIYDSAATRDSSGNSHVLAYSTFSSFWESKGLGEEWPNAQKTATHVALDYIADSRSSVSVRMLQGADYATGEAVSLHTSSRVSQAYAYPYAPSRYAALRVESEGQDFELERMHVTMRIGGR